MCCSYNLPPYYREKLSDLHCMRVEVSIPVAKRHLFDHQST
jgi:hypothetical protein